MTAFLIKGLLRDRSRSLFPVLVVALGVMLAVFLHAWLGGAIGDIISTNARFTTGHVRIMTKEYSQHEDQLPNDCALLHVSGLMGELRGKYPGLAWVRRIRFGGLLDVPDSNGETRIQAPVMGLGADLLTIGGSERKTLNIEKAVIAGRMIAQSGEVLIGSDLAAKLTLSPGGRVTLIGSTMNGSMAVQNFTVAGVVRFGVSAMDRGAMILDITGAEAALDMEDAAGEILGFFPADEYDDAAADPIRDSFNHSHPSGEFAPRMFTLREQNGLGELLDYALSMSGILVSVFVFAMSLVLWNAGLMGGLRRYGEVGVRLAIGEDKGHVYRSMILESVIIGLAGSLAGTAAGLAVAYYIQSHGIDISGLFQSSTMMISDVLGARVTPVTYTIGFIPGLFSTVLGTVLSGVGIYKRNTAQLFRELEV